MLHHPSTVPEPQAASPAQLFEKILPKILEGRAEAAKALGGRLLFAVRGSEGGCWLVDFGDRRVFRGAPAQVDCALVMSRDAFTRLLKGSLDIEAAALERSLEVRGDVEALLRLAELLSP